ncbi:hypothetical protein TcYC6_0001750 [Trypanosoma cruzi]|nr:hypothetical protein TcYC6_0001750 [Trypanosoma cruzi]
MQTCGNNKEGAATTIPWPRSVDEIRYDKLFVALMRGMVFVRLVDEIHHKWAYYNDTNGIPMNITVSFGREAQWKPLARRVHHMDAALGICSIDLLLPPGGTELFMRGEYNGFRGHYEAASSRDVATGERRK